MPGEMAEWSIAAVLKTVEVRASGGSNPSLSAKQTSKIVKSTVNQTITVLFDFRRIAKKCDFGQLKPAKSLTHLKNKKC